MKKTITTLALALTIIGSAVAQRPAMKGSSGSRTRSTTQTKGQMKDQATDDEEFSVRYQINTSKINSSYEDNSKEMNELRCFIKEITCDDKRQISRINVCGYSSPDGSMAANQRLATARAKAFRNYLDTKCDLSMYGGETIGVASTWSDAKQCVEKSSIPQKSEVLQLLDSSQPEMSIEARLRAMNSSWRYMVSNILPPMRCVEVEIFYTKNCPTEQPKEKPKAKATEPTVVEEVVLVRNNYIFFVSEDDSDIKIIDNSYALPLDYEIEDRVKFVFKDNRRREKIKGAYRDAFGRERSSVKYK
ncbi:MAG: hypothetical protein SNF68_03035 [Rikenellaceae bacterium]